MRRLRFQFLRSIISYLSENVGGWNMVVREVREVRGEDDEDVAYLCLYYGEEQPAVALT